VIKDVNDRLIKMVELCALDGYAEQNSINYRNLMETCNNDYLF